MVTLRIKADVQNDRLVLVTLPPEVPTGPAELVVTVDSGVAAQGAPRRTSMLNFLESLPPGPSPRCFLTWEEYERHLQDEKDAWER